MAKQPPLDILPQRCRGKLWPRLLLGCVLPGILITWLFWSYRVDSLLTLPEIDPSMGDHSPPGPTGGNLWVSPWRLITPSKQLSYAPCFGRYQCARLEVPMDWNRTSQDEEQVALAIIRLPAVVPVTDPRYGGAVLVNPGGPGGSGIHKVLEQGEGLQKILDSPNDPSFFYTPTTTEDKYFDIIGFDPRGVNNTTPRYECFSHPYSRQRWTLDNRYLDLLGSSDVATAQAWERAIALAATCTRHDGPKIGRFMNTTPTVADMIEIIERHGEWRESEASIIISNETALSEAQKEFILNATRWRQGEELLQYWGFSYGSVLGATFAAMHPQRVGRVLLDGVCDARAMYSGFWTTSLLDTDRVMGHFFKTCGQAGPDRCSFSSANSSQDLGANLEQLLHSLNRTPLAVPGSDTRGPDVITFSDVMRLIKESLYVPLKSFPVMADLLADVSRGDGGAFADMKNAGKVAACPMNDEQDCQEFYPPYKDTLLETLASISCTDGEDLSDLTKEEFFDYYEVLKGQSRWMADIWAAFTMPCWRWKTRPKWRYEGPIAGRPAHPMLWIGNTMDPATPLRNAYELAAGFSGSVVLEQDSSGHCSYSSPSECTASNIRQYFQAGTLPEPGTRCSPDRTPFDV